MALFSRMVFSIAFVSLAVPMACSQNNSGASQGGPGAASGDFLSATNYTSLAVEIQAVGGYELDAQAQANLVAFLQSRLNKPAGVRMSVDDPLASTGQSSFSVSDARSIETGNRRSESSGSQLAAYVLVLDGSSTSDAGGSKILGQAYAPTSVVLFEKTIRSLAGALGQPSRTTLETTILEHEFGHLLGLVNTGIPPQTNHQDSAHGAHCTESSCLMHYSVDTSDIIANLVGGTVPSLDAGCLQDLKAAGGK